MTGRTVGRTVGWILDRCGDEIILIEGEHRCEIRGVIQPITQNSDEKRLPTAIGQMDEGRYLYLGLPQYPIAARQSEIVWRGQTFGVQNAHPIYIGDEISHWWGILVRLGKEGAT